MPHSGYFSLILYFEQENQKHSAHPGIFNRRTTLIEEMDRKITNNDFVFDF